MVIDGDDEDYASYRKMRQNRKFLKKTDASDDLLDMDNNDTVVVNEHTNNDGTTSTKKRYFNGLYKLGQFNKNIMVTKNLNKELIKMRKKPDR
jgi:hypothetical protein